MDILKAVIFQTPRLLRRFNKRKARTILNRLIQKKLKLQDRSSPYRGSEFHLWDMGAQKTRWV